VSGAHLGMFLSDLAENSRREWLSSEDNSCSFNTSVDTYVCKRTTRHHPQRAVSAVSDQVSRATADL
jgi:peroxiredoxin